MSKKILKIISVIFVAGVVCSILIGVIMFARWRKSDDYVQFDKKRLNEVYTSLTILDNNGKTLNEPLYLYDYKQTPLDSLHDYTCSAFVAVEDKRFYTHNGIDYKRVAGAIVHNLKSGGYKEGASTISQQLIKNTHLNNNKTLTRKVNEMLLARELEKNYSKHDILEMYLNTIYFGRNAYGIESASNVYFNKSAKDLTVSESAILAGMIKAPNTYAPDKNGDKCMSRRNNVLKIMYEQNAIDEEQYNEALGTEIKYCPQTANVDKTYGYHVMREACRVLNMTPMQLAQSNFVIETYCDSAIQEELRKCVLADKTLNKDNKLSDLSCVITDNNGGIVACYSRGDNYETPRQAGSALKPLAVYAPALNERIITQASPVLDEETDFNGYKPSNMSGYNGWTTIKYSVAKSLNVPAVKTLNALGLATAQKYLSKFGIEGNQNLSLALGNTANGIDIFTLVKGYETLAKDGVCDNECFIKNIYSENGVIYSRKHNQERVFQPAANYLMTDMLLNTVSNGTAKKLKNKRYQVAAKTGTVGNSDGNSDAIIAGYTTMHTFAAWYSGNLPNSVSGSGAPCELINSLFEKIYSEKKPQDFTIPENVVELQLDKESLDYNQKMVICSNGEKYLFDNANKPKEQLTTEKNDYTIQLTNNANNVEITLPIVENCEWTLYKITEGTKEQLTLTNNRYKEPIHCDTEYFAELSRNGKLLYVTPKVKACYTSIEDNKQDKAPSILDFWYFK